MLPYSLARDTFYQQHTLEHIFNHYPAKTNEMKKLQKILLRWSWQPVINACRANEAIMTTMTPPPMMMMMVMKTMVLAASD